MICFGSQYRAIWVLVIVHCHHPCFSQKMQVLCEALRGYVISAAEVSLFLGCVVNASPLLHPLA